MAIMAIGLSCLESAYGPVTDVLVSKLHFKWLLERKL
jgi:hypothetical protein